MASSPQSPPPSAQPSDTSGLPPPHEDQFRHLIEQNIDGVVILDRDGHIQYTNPAAQSMFRRTEQELTGAPFGFPTTGAYTHEIDLIRPDGTTLPIELRVLGITWQGDIGYLAFLRDITDRRQSEQDRKRHEMERQYAQKLESLGVLAGGVAHDFNNLLMTVVTRAGLAMRSLPPDALAREHLQYIERAGLRGGELANQMLTFAGQTQLDFQPINLSVLIKDMNSLIRSIVSKRINLHINTERGLPSIRGDRAQLRQMIINVITNAAEAIENTEGTITITTDLFDSSSQDFRAFHMVGDLPWGPCVRLTITDTGIGMRSDLIPKIFDPFFTTKVPGRGLGLAALLGITRAHEAAIAIHSQINQGSQFWFLFPCTSPRTPASGTPTLTMPTKPQTTHGSKVLVVDDEEDVREACSLVLQEIGLETLVAADGRSGLQLFSQYHEHIALVLLDLTMPHMDGGLLCQEIRLLNPEVPILVASGYAEKEAMKHFMGLTVEAFIQKPFQVEVLIEKVQSLTRPKAHLIHPSDS